MGIVAIPESALYNKGRREHAALIGQPQAGQSAGTDGGTDRQSQSCSAVRQGSRGRTCSATGSASTKSGSAGSAVSRR
jgi:hypothetical protein